MRTIKLWCVVALVLAGCEMASTGSRAQAVAGPGGVTVAPPTIGGVAIAGELLVSWTPDPDASKYYVLQSASGAPYALAAAIVGNPPDSTPASTLTVTDLSAGSYCFAIQAAYPDGTMSDPGAAGCGTATGAALPPTTVRTLIVPVLPVRILSPLVAQWASVGGQGSASHWAYIPLSLPVGETIMAIRSRVEDAGSGTTLRERLLEMSDAQELFSVVATSPPSGGVGADETLTIPGPILTAPTTQYVLEVGNAANPANLDSKLFRVEVDLQ